MWVVHTLYQRICILYIYALHMYRHTLDLYVNLGCSFPVSMKTRIYVCKDSCNVGRVGRI